MQAFSVSGCRSGTVSDTYDLHEVTMRQPTTSPAAAVRDFVSACQTLTSLIDLAGQPTTSPQLRVALAEYCRAHATVDPGLAASLSFWKRRRASLTPTTTTRFAPSSTAMARSSPRSAANRHSERFAPRRRPGPHRRGIPDGPRRHWQRCTVGTSGRSRASSAPLREAIAETGETRCLTWSPTRLPADGVRALQYDGDRVPIADRRGSLAGPRRAALARHPFDRLVEFR